MLHNSTLKELRCALCIVILVYFSIHTTSKKSPAYKNEEILQFFTFLKIKCHIPKPYLTLLTVFENHQKCRIWIFKWHFPPIFIRLKVTCLVTLFDHKLQVFKNSPKWTFFDIFNELLSAQNVNVARFARNVEWDFFCDFQTLCCCICRYIYVQYDIWSQSLLPSQKPFLIYFYIFRFYNYWNLCMVSIFRMHS